MASSQRHILGSQVADVHQLAEHLGFDITDFSWELRVGKYFIGEVSCLVHTDTGYYFLFDFKRGQHYGIYSPAKDLPVIEQSPKTWERQLDYVRDWLESLRRELSTVSNSPIYETPSAVERIVPSSKEVFVVCGHDGENAHQLIDLIKERFKLIPIMLKYRAGKGRPLIVKFEQEAENCSFAFVLLTPDDLVKTEDAEYSQARPNVIFELGWFYGRLGHERVLLLLKHGTMIHSDLAGVSRIEFQESVSEKIIEIERELIEAGML